MLVMWPLSHYPEFCVKLWDGRGCSTALVGRRFILVAYELLYL